MNVIEYVTEEVKRQGHDITVRDGIDRVGWMLDAWSYALKKSESQTRPYLEDLVLLGKLVEPVKNCSGLRTVGVRVGTRICPPPEEVKESLRAIFMDDWKNHLEPLDLYRRVLDVHGFVDGNGRSGKIILNWAGGTLLNPIFPPNDFWGYPIRNP